VCDYEKEGANGSNRTAKQNGWEMEKREMRRGLKVEKKEEARDEDRKGFTFLAQVKKRVQYR
jgi:hypothetical protein